MKDKDINKFIEEMGKIGDQWTEEQVKDVYKNTSLEKALKERTDQVDMFLNSVATALLGKDKK